MRLVLFTLLIFVAQLSFASGNFVSKIILKEPNGTPVRYIFDQAVIACPPGYRLPTAREFAVYAQSRGAKGILETYDVPTGQTPLLPYLKISVVNPDNSRDEFYFNYEGFVPEQSDLREHYFWSSSRELGVPNKAFQFNVFYGSLDSWITYYDSCSALCISI